MKNKYYFKLAVKNIPPGKSPAAYRVAFDILRMSYHTSIRGLADAITDELTRHGVKLPATDVTFEQYRKDEVK